MNTKKVNKIVFSLWFISFVGLQVFIWALYYNNIYADGWYRIPNFIGFGFMSLVCSISTLVLTAASMSILLRLYHSAIVVMILFGIELCLIYLIFFVHYGQQEEYLFTSAIVSSAIMPLCIMGSPSASLGP